MVTVAAYLSNKQTIHTSWFVHSSYIDSKTCELKDIYNWSRTNNLSLSRSITVDIVFTDNRRHRQPLHSFPALPGIGRVARLKSGCFSKTFISACILYLYHIIILAPILFRYTFSVCSCFLSTILVPRDAAILARSWES